MIETDALTAALGPWLSAAARKLNPEQLQALYACLEAPGADVRVVVELRAGAIVLECSTAGKRLELYREQVDPLQPTVFH